MKENCSVINMKTDDRENAPIFMGDLIHSDDKLYVGYGIKAAKGTYYHLHIVNPKEKICCGDWITDGKIIYKAPDVELDAYIGLYKIIASSDESLGLPEISVDFVYDYIKEYNLNNILINILVEYNEYMSDSINQDTNIYLKTDEDNCVIITRLKETWTKKELLEKLTHLENCLYQQYYSSKDLDKRKLFLKQWVDINL